MNRILIALAMGTALSFSASAADLDRNRGLKDDSPAQVDYSWSGPWLALMGGYGTLAQSEGDNIFGVEGAFAELQAGYDLQFGRGVVGGFGCAGYSAIDGLNQHFCLGLRGGLLVSNESLLYVPLAWQWQNVDSGEGGDSIYFSGPSVGLGLQTRIGRNVSLKVEATHQWIWDADGEDVSDENVADNRIKAGLVFQFGSPAELLR